MRACPDCGLVYQEPKTVQEKSAPFVCKACIQKADPRPHDGWPIIARWISPTKGRGVFASRPILKGETIERCWVMTLGVEESTQTKMLPTLNRYLFPWTDGQRAMISGEGLLYNHSVKEATGKDPNAECVLRRGISAVEFRALRDIPEGEEITWNYKKAITRTR